MNICYSTNDEEYNLTSMIEVLDDLDSDGRLEVGAVYYEADCRRMTAADVVSVDRIIEDMGDRLYEEVGEVADDYPAVKPEAKAELEALLHTWIEKHANPDGYWIVVGKTREKRVTADDLPHNVEVTGLAAASLPQGPCGLPGSATGSAED